MKILPENLPGFILPPDSTWLAWLNLIVSAWVVLSALSVIALLIGKKLTARDAEMNAHDFVVHKSQKAAEDDLLKILVVGIFAVYQVIFPEQDLLYTFLSGLTTFAAAAISMDIFLRGFSRLTVFGDRFTYRSLLRGERKFYIHEIRRIEVEHMAFLTGPYRITMHSEYEKLAAVSPFSVDHAGYSLLVKRLKASGIADSEDLPEEIEPVRHVLLRSMGFMGLVFLIFQLYLILIAMAPFFITERAEWYFSGAYTAYDVLLAHYAWLNDIFIAMIAAPAIILLGNIAIIVFLKHTSRFTKAHLWTAAIGIVAITAVFGLMFLEEDVPGLMRSNQKDLAAIESGDLPSMTYQINLSWQNFYRTASLQDFGEYRPLYVVRSGAEGRLYFPRSLSPAVLKEIAAGEEYQLSGTAAGTRRFELRHTPNFHLVVYAAPISLGH